MSVVLIRNFRKNKYFIDESLKMLKKIRKKKYDTLISYFIDELNQDLKLKKLRL